MVASTTPSSIHGCLKEFPGQNIDTFTKSDILERSTPSSSLEGFVPYKSFHPGVILREEFMEEMDIMELSKKAGLNIKVIKPVTKCKAPVTQEIAEGLARAFDTTVEFWLNLQDSYDNWYRRNLFKGFSDTVGQQNMDVKLLRGSNVGKSSSMTSMIQVFPKNFGRTLMMESLKERDDQLVAMTDPTTKNQGISIQPGEAICLAPRFFQK